MLPIIATEMKAPATKDKACDELASTLNEQMNDHVKEIAEAAVDQVIQGVADVPAGACTSAAHR